MSGRVTEQRGLTIGLAHIVLIGFSLFALAPLYWMVTTSMKPLSEALQSPPTIFPQEVSWEAYARAFASTPFARWVFNSAFVAVVTASLNVIFGAMAGFALSRLQFRGRALFLTVILASMMIPFEATFISNFVLVNNLGWYNSYQALIVPWSIGAFGVFLFRQEFLSIPDDLFEAAWIDGSSTFKAFRTIALPMVRSTSLTVFMLQLIWSWNALLWPLLVTSEVNMRVVQLGLVAFKTEGGVFVNLLMAAATMSVIPMAVLFVVAQRFVIEGIGSGAVK
jgi:ABC-type glycerol-3-phosphate transport system permease component